MSSDCEKHKIILIEISIYLCCGNVFFTFFKNEQNHRHFHPDSRIVQIFSSFKAQLKYCFHCEPTRFSSRYRTISPSLKSNDTLSVPPTEFFSFRFLCFYSSGISSKHLHLGSLITLRPVFLFLAHIT